MGCAPSTNDCVTAFSWKLSRKSTRTPKLSDCACCQEDSTSHSQKDLPSDVISSRRSQSSRKSQSAPSKKRRKASKSPKQVHECPTIHVEFVDDSQLRGLPQAWYPTCSEEADDFKVAFEPGRLGLLVSNTGEIKEVYNNGQAVTNGVPVDMLVNEIDGQPFSDQLMNAKADISEDCELTFNKVAPRTLVISGKSEAVDGTYELQDWQKNGREVWQQQDTGTKHLVLYCMKDGHWGVTATPRVNDGSRHFLCSEEPATRLPTLQRWGVRTHGEFKCSRDVQVAVVKDAARAARPVKATTKPLRKKLKQRKGSSLKRRSASKTEQPSHEEAMMPSKVEERLTADDAHVCRDTQCNALKPES